MVYYQLNIDKAVTLKTKATTGSIIVIQSATLNTNPKSTNNFDNTHVNLLNEKGDILLTIAPRYSQNAIVFNSKPVKGDWGPEEREKLEGKFKSETPSITIYEHPDRYQVLFDFETVKYYNKRLPGETVSIAYRIHEGQESIFSNPLGINTYDSFAAFVGKH